jgi:hypothetical protein
MGHELMTHVKRVINKGIYKRSILREFLLFFSPF